MQSKGLKEMKTIGEEFNPDFHEAITEIPVPDEKMKGRVVDEVEKGYSLGDKIIRFAKVVVGK
jgi:molecular chaperone GrpE